MGEAAGGNLGRMRRVITAELKVGRRGGSPQGTRHGTQTRLWRKNLFVSEENARDQDWKLCKIPVTHSATRARPTTDNGIELRGTAVVCNEFKFTFHSRHQGHIFKTFKSVAVWMRACVCFCFVWRFKKKVCVLKFCWKTHLLSSFHTLLLSFIFLTIYQSFSNSLLHTHTHTFAFGYRFSDEV